MNSHASPKDWDGQLETLDDLSQAVHYNHWIYTLMEPYLGKRVLEVGCGTGNMTELLAKGRKVLSLDVNPFYLAIAKKRLKKNPLASFRQINLEKGFEKIKNFKPDTIFCSNVMEHIFDDQHFLKECHSILPKGGRILIFVPALPSLYGSMDKSYGHFRRYTKKDLKMKVSKNCFVVVCCRYLNLLGIFGWWLNGRVFNRLIVPKGQLLLYDKILRFVVLIEKWLPKPIGLSLFCVGERL